MARMNDEVAAVLQEYADLMAITRGDGFRVRTYEKAARPVGGYPEDIPGWTRRVCGRPQCGRIDRGARNAAGHLIEGATQGWREALAFDKRCPGRISPRAVAWAARSVKGGTTVG